MSCGVAFCLIVLGAFACVCVYHYQTCGGEGQWWRLRDFIARVKCGIWQDSREPLLPICCTEGAAQKCTEQDILSLNSEMSPELPRPKMGPLEGTDSPGLASTARLDLAAPAKPFELGPLSQRQKLRRKLQLREAAAAVASASAAVAEVKDPPADVVEDMKVWEAKVEELSIELGEPFKGPCRRAKASRKAHSRTRRLAKGSGQKVVESQDLPNSEHGVEPVASFEVEQRALPITGHDVLEGEQMALPFKGHGMVATAYESSEAAHSVSEDALSLLYSDMVEAESHLDSTASVASTTVPSDIGICPEEEGAPGSRNGQRRRRRSQVNKTRPAALKASKLVESKVLNGLQEPQWQAPNVPDDEALTAMLSHANPDQDWEWQCPAGHRLEPRQSPEDLCCSSCGFQLPAGALTLWSPVSGWAACEECIRMACEQPARSVAMPESSLLQHTPAVGLDPARMTPEEIAEWFKQQGSEDLLRECMAQVLLSAATSQSSEI